jgi:hypothetical protein
LSSYRGLGWVVAASTLLASAVPALADDGGLVGWVESTRGVPVAGAVVSLFGKGIRGGNLVTLSDSDGQFVLPSLPPGSYTLRAVGIGHEPSAAQHITVVANRESLFTVSLKPVGEKGEQATADRDAAETDAQREWRWLMRHKKRSVLETAAHEHDAFGGEATQKASLEATKRPSLDDLGLMAGNVELVATSNGAGASDSGAAVPGGVGALHLSGRIADGIRWNLGGLVAENEGRAWRTAAQFVIDPGGGHSIEAGAGYGAGDTRLLVAQGLAQPDRAMGAVFAKDRWQIDDRVAATAAARYTYIGFLPDSHHADAVLEVELRGSPHTVLRGSLATRTLAPGGDLLTLSTLASSPAITWARLDNGLQSARTLRYELGVDHSLGPAQLRARLFDEGTHDLLLTTFDDATPFVRNAGRAGARGFAVTLGRRFGGIANGSLTYSFGRTRRGGAFIGGAPLTTFDEADFHDLVARLETVIDWTDTRIVAYYRLNGLADRKPGPVPSRTQPARTTATRFDVHLAQGLPFLQPLTRADWELLFAVRNMFYEASEGAFLDELAVEDPPMRVVGGISVRF